MGKTYASSGVDIDRGDRFAEFIKNIRSKAVSGEIGGFAGGIEIDATAYKKPVLLSTTDGVGTKLLVAQKLKKFDTIGIDLVAMNVNDLIVCGAKPLTFLDYVACGLIDESVLHPIIQGIVKGCELAECTLTGGETAEMPDLYKDGDFDLAGFCVGLVEKEDMLPKTGAMKAGDIIIGIPSSGIHSNGLSLARKAVPETDEKAYAELLVPTLIYVRELLTLIATGEVLGAAHITGGGLVGNFVRVIPQHLAPRFSYDWEVPWIFDAIQKYGSVDMAEMRRVFNMGIGIALVARKEGADKVMETGKLHGIPLRFIGELIRG